MLVSLATGDNAVWCRAGAGAVLAPLRGAFTSFLCLTARQQQRCAGPPSGTPAQKKAATFNRDSLANLTLTDQH